MDVIYEQTEYDRITPPIERRYERISKARGIRVVPLAVGQKPPESEELNDTRWLLNNGAAAELEEVCGIGEELALAVVAHRETHGAFSSADDLEAVAGIGPATARKLWGRD